MDTAFLIVEGFNRCICQCLDDGFHLVSVQFFEKSMSIMDRLLKLCPAIANNVVVIVCNFAKMGAYHPLARFLTRKAGRNSKFNSLVKDVVSTLIHTTTWVSSPCDQLIFE